MCRKSKSVITYTHPKEPSKTGELVLNFVDTLIVLKNLGCSLRLNLKHCGHQTMLVILIPSPYCLRFHVTTVFGGTSPVQQQGTPTTYGSVSAPSLEVSPFRVYICIPRHTSFQKKSFQFCPIRPELKNFFTCKDCILGTFEIKNFFIFFFLRSPFPICPGLGFYC